MKKKVYVSSTYEDLRKYREAVNKTLKQMGYEDVAMEYYAAEGRPPLNRCLEDVEDCDIYVCIVAWHYGSIPEGKVDSFTQMEYDHARKHYKKILIFLQDEKSLWHPNLMDATSKNENSSADPACRIIDFRHKLANQNIVAFFSSPHNLCQELIIGLASLERIMRPANISQLPEPLTGIEVVGRDETIEQLIRYYKDAKTAVVTCIGEPGLGKSLVVRRFLKSFNNDDISSKDRPILKAQWVYGWSFFHQGSDDIPGSSKIILEDTSTEFFANVLKFYGFEEFPYSEEQQAELLIELIRTEESMLILDGLDPLLEECNPDGLLKNIQSKGKEFLKSSKKKDTEQFRINELTIELKGLAEKISSHKSFIKDRAIKIFLQKLCDETKKADYPHRGLVIITARKAFSDLDAYLGNYIYREIYLKSLDDEKGAELLDITINGLTNDEKNKVVVAIRNHRNDFLDKPKNEIFQNLSKEANGNPLGLTLMGKLFVQSSKKHNDVDSLNNYKSIFHFNSKKKTLSQRILDNHYKNWCHSSEYQIIARIRFLYILSLFSRPMQKEEFSFLCEITNEPDSKKFVTKGKNIQDIFKICCEDNKLKDFLNPIKDLKEEQKELTESNDFEVLEEDLLNLGLIVKRNNFEWDTHHSLIRNFFAAKFIDETDEVWCNAHAILFIYFVPEQINRRPETQAELTPVIRAIHHGCLSRNYQAAYELYEKLVIRGQEGFITENLGLVAWDLNILSRFSFLNDFDTKSNLSYDKLSRKSYLNLNDSDTGTDSSYKKLEINQLCVLLSRKAYCIELQGEFDKAINLRQITINLYKIIIERLTSDTNKTFCKKDNYNSVKALKDLAHAHEKLAWLLARTKSINEAKDEAKNALGAIERAIKIKDEIGNDSTNVEIKNKCDGIDLPIKELEEQRYQSQATLGAMFHRLGRLKDAKDNFNKAEEFYQNAEISNNDKPFAVDPKLRRLHSEYGCRYCFLLMDMHYDSTLPSTERPSLTEIKMRKDYMENWSKAEEKKHEYNRSNKQGELVGFHQRPPTLLIQAAHQIAKGLYFLAEYQERGDSNNEESAEDAFNLAIQLTQKAHNKSFQCQPLLGRAMLRRYSKIYSLALKDLEKVIELAGEMKLYQVDAKLLKGNILLDQALSFLHDKSEEKYFHRDENEQSPYNNWVEEAECCLENVKENIKILTYRLRDNDQELLELRIDIAKLTIKCIEDINKETIEKEIQKLEAKLQAIKNNSKPIHEHEFKLVENEIEDLRKENKLE